MAGRHYERLPIEVFGRATILTGDLDPVYIALKEAKWPAKKCYPLAGWWSVAAWT
jgi:hypothetical protein